ncbi:MAG: PAS domain S-box protein, partial [Gammaproteobacteria bacterium]|nr:PAS domain S-box protein [Gammaproteobacteria bacterium]
MKLSSRIIVLFAATLVVVSVITISLAASRFTEQNTQLVRDWGKTLTMSLAESIANQTIEGNVIKTQEILTSVVNKNADLEYVFLTDFDGNVFAYSFKDGFPANLLSLVAHEDAEVTKLTLDGKRINNFSYPLVDGLDARLHIGVNVESQLQARNKLVNNIIVVTTLIGLAALILGWFISYRLTRDVDEVVKVMNKYGVGHDPDWDGQTYTSPEAAQLMDAFKSMVQAKNQSEHERIISEELLERIFDNTHAMMAYLDTSFNFVRVNKAYLSADNKTADELIGKNHFDLYPNEENEKIFKQVLESGQTHFARAKPFEYEYSPDKGVTHWDWSLQPIYEKKEITALLLVLVDVTEQIISQEKLIQQDEALRASKELNDTIIASSPVGIAIYDSDGQCVAANRALADIVGATEKQVLQQNYHEIESWKNSGLYDLANSVIDSGDSQRSEFSVQTTFKKPVSLDVYFSRFESRGKKHLLL